MCLKKRDDDLYDLALALTIPPSASECPLLSAIALHSLLPGPTDRTNTWDNQ